MSRTNSAPSPAGSAPSAGAVETKTATRPSALTGPAEPSPPAFTNAASPAGRETGSVVLNGSARSSTRAGVVPRTPPIVVTTRSPAPSIVPELAAFDGAPSARSARLASTISKALLT